jgi:hypothetical protein
LGIIKHNLLFNVKLKFKTMKINYVLHPNTITPDQNVWKANVVNKTVFNIDDVVKQITGEGSILKLTECNAVINAFLSKIGTNLADGIFFQSDYFSVSTEISGVFAEETDKFDVNRHLIYPNLNAGKPWKESLAIAKLEKVTTDENKPKPESFVDMKSKTNDQTLTPGGMAELQGEMLKIDETADDEGIFIVSGNGGGETKVAYLHQNYPKCLQFEVPEILKQGSYKVEVRNRAHKGKTIRVGILEFTLNVA